MASGWAQRWRRVPGLRRLQGGQGISFVAEPIEGSGDRVFIKELNRPRDARARRRFVREVTAYETIQAEGVPRLVEHNATSWRDTRVPLYLALEYIEGITLSQRISDIGPLSLPGATECIAAVADTLGQCHADEVVHRDLKPANIVLRDGDHRRPVVVDFGLSFNDADSEHADLTRAGDEVGNRFLRLPEHARGGRSPVSDVTQLAGLLLYLLTGTEPRVLVDDDGNKPHQRPDVAARLNTVCRGRVRLRLLSLFDRAFDPRLLARIGSAVEFRDILAQVASPDSDDDGFDALMARLDEVTNQPALQESAVNARRLTQYVQHATAAVRTLSERQGLLMSQSGHRIEAAAAVPAGETRLALMTHGTNQPRWVVYRFELRGPDDLVLLADGVEIWRGADGQAAQVAEAAQRAAVEAFLADAAAAPPNDPPR